MKWPLHPLTLANFSPEELTLIAKIKSDPSWILQRHHGSGRRRSEARRSCTVCGCSGRITKGLCVMHYARFRKHGSPYIYYERRADNTFERKDERLNEQFGGLEQGYP